MEKKIAREKSKEADEFLTLDEALNVAEKVESWDVGRSEFNNDGAICSGIHFNGSLDGLKITIIRKNERVHRWDRGDNHYQLAVNSPELEELGVDFPMHYVQYECGEYQQATHVTKPGMKTVRWGDQRIAKFYQQVYNKVEMPRVRAEERKWKIEGERREREKVAILKRVKKLAEEG